MIPVALAAAGISAIPSIIKGVSGLFQIGKGNRLAKQNIRPVQLVNENIAKNAAMAEQMAQQGLPQAQYNQAIQGINRNQSGAYAGLGRSANPSAGLASLVRAGNDAVLNLGAADAQARMQNQRFAFGQRSALAQEQKDAFNWNSKQKYNEQAQAAAALQGAGRQNAFGAASDLAQIGSSYLQNNGGKGESSSMPNQLGNLSPNQPTLYGYNGGFKTNRLY